MPGEDGIRLLANVIRTLQTAGYPVPAETASSVAAAIRRGDLVEHTKKSILGQIHDIVVQHRGDIEPFIPFLWYTLNDSSPHVRQRAFSVLLWHPAYKANSAPLFAILLKHLKPADFYLHEEQEQGRLYVWHQFDSRVRHAQSARELTDLGQILDSWFSGHYGGKNPPRSRMEWGIAICAKKRVTTLCAEIAERNAILAKTKDGELLAGETIPKPAREGRGMYRAVRCMR